MSKYEKEMIAMLIDDVPPSDALARWLRTPRGERELEQYRQTLGALDTLYERSASVAPQLVSYSDVPTPIGRLLVATSDAGLMRVAFRTTSETEFVTQLRRRPGTQVTRSAARTAEIVRQLRAYFAGERRTFDLRVDLAGVSPFQRRVLQAAAEVPPGRVVSYGDIARRIGQPGGSRAVGQALGANPIPIIIPCHRVVAAGGRIGGYGGGLRIKRKLLRLEGALAANA